jgi:long-chain acyl-CoA synthetase
MRIAFRLQVVDANLLPPSPFLLCANHASYLDPFAIAAALPHRRLRDTYWGGWTGLLFANRWQCLFSRVARVIPVDPDRAMITSLALASVVLARGKNLVWFPEGERSLDGRLLPFRQGIAYVLERNPVAIVPACVSGAFEAWPPGTRFPRRRPITVRFGAALDAARLLAVANGQPRHECIVESVRDAIAQLAPQNRR